MKQLILAIAILIPTLVKSQDTIRIPAVVGKQIVKDLISYDSTKAELKLIQEQLRLTEQKVATKDSSISIYELKSIAYKKEIEAGKKEASIWQGQYKVLQKQNKRLKAKLIFTKIVSGVIIGTVTYFGLIR